MRNEMRESCRMSFSVSLAIGRPGYDADGADPDREMPLFAGLRPLHARSRRKG
jgi:hypothetical protein